MQSKFRLRLVGMMTLALAGFTANALALPAESNGISACAQDRNFVWPDGSGNITQLQTCNLYESVPGTAGPEPAEISSPALSVFDGFYSGWALGLLRVWEGAPEASDLSDFVLLTRSDPANFADTATLYSKGAQDFQTIYELALQTALADGWTIQDQTEHWSGATPFEVAWYPDSPGGEFGYDLIVVHSDVPEPASLALFALALGAALRRHRAR